MKKKIIGEWKSIGKNSVRDNLCCFYNELQETMSKAFREFKKKPTKAMIKKVGKPVFDRWEKRFENISNLLTFKLEIPKSSIKKIKLQKKLRK